MKTRYTFVLPFILVLHFLSAQEFTNFTSLSIHAGVQNPIELGHLDLYNVSYGDYFEPGNLFGISINKDWGKAAISFQGEYLYNPMNIGKSNKNLDLHSIKIDYKFWYNFLNPASRMKLKAGTGLGVLGFKYPERSYPPRFGPDIIDNYHVYEAYIEFSLAYTTALNFTYRINHMISLSTTIGNDFVYNYGDEQTVLLTSFSASINYTISK
ncbi:hypothetical protein [Portibacter lacus]|uniref:Outer membrane protein beta-barrel domain-containing protein n=1 Tax=Portibacter lacus TaxID=1099794 RepID=A0AA37SMW3_9BACT|nr:hypothetical protein [Portibacter lacus]GLR17708.1 hypothetical protein GCM10007940_23230 [Portibacter lacus]